MVHAMPTLLRPKAPRRGGRPFLRGTFLAASLLLPGACTAIDPGAVSGEVKLLVLSLDPASGQQVLGVGQVSTLHELRTLKGDAARMLAGADILVDYDELARENPQTAKDIERITYKTKGSPVDFAYFEVDGVIHPEDFHSLNMSTIYYNFEKAYLYFKEMGVDLPELPVQYMPRMREGPNLDIREQTDNAYWNTTIRTFAILPFKNVQELPLGMNAGVVAHEFSHAVFSHKVYPGEALGWLFQRYALDPEKWSPVVNLERSFNEGLADFFGAAITGDPGFIRKSLSMVEEERRLDPPAPRCLTAEMKSAAERLSPGAYDPYPMASVLAAALWAVEPRGSGQMAQFAQGLVDGMEEIGKKLEDRKEATRIPHFVDALAKRFPADLKPRACGLLVDRLGLRSDSVSGNQVPSCTELEQPRTRCSP